MTLPARKFGTVVHLWRCTIPQRTTRLAAMIHTVSNRLSYPRMRPAPFLEIHGGSKGNLKANLCKNSLFGVIRTFSTKGEYRPRVRAYLDYKFFRDNKEAVAENSRKRNYVVDVDKVQRLYQETVQTQILIEKLNTERKQKALERNVDEGRRIKEEIALLEHRKLQVVTFLRMQPDAFAQMEEEMLLEAIKIPNQTHPDVPLDQEKILKYIGEKREFDFPFKSHLELGRDLDVLDFESAVTVSGEKFYFLKNEVALLELALTNWAVSKLVSKGYTPVITPDLVHREIAEGCGYRPRVEEGSQIYAIEDHPLCLVGTAEIPLAGMYANKIVHAEQLPIKMVGYGHCFRVEAGHRGTETKGLYRVHQFSKVEMFAICPPTASEVIHEEMLAIQEELFSELGLHCRVLDMPMTDLGASASRKFDIEAWMPSRDSYGEISSTSNCLDYQSRRLNIRFKVGHQKDNRFAHTVNGTACAVPRMVLAILENFQQGDGKVVIPKPLVPFMGGIELITPKMIVHSTDN